MLQIDKLRLVLALSTISQLLIFFVFPMVRTHNEDGSVAFSITVAESIWDSDFGILMFFFLILAFFFYFWVFYKTLNYVDLHPKSDKRNRVDYWSIRNRFLKQIYLPFLVLVGLMWYGTNIYNSRIEDEITLALTYSYSSARDSLINDFIFYNGIWLVFWIGIMQILIVLYIQYDNFANITRTSSSRYQRIRSWINTKFGLGFFEPKLTTVSKQTYYTSIVLSSFLIISMAFLDETFEDAFTILFLLAVLISFTLCILYFYQIILSFLTILNSNDKLTDTLLNDIKLNKSHSALFVASLVSIIPDWYNLDTSGIIIIFAIINFSIMILFFFILSFLKKNLKHI